MIESEFQNVYNYSVYPSDSRIINNKGFVNFDNSSMEGSHWTWFKYKDKKSYYFDRFGWSADEFLLNQLTEPITYHKYKIQEI